MRVYNGFSFKIATLAIKRVDGHVCTSSNTTSATNVDVIFEPYSCLTGIDKKKLPTA